MDAAEFLNAVPDLTPIIGDDEDVRQDVFLRLWEKRNSIRNMPHYARKAAKLAAIDASKASEREAARFTPLRDDDAPAGRAVSPLATMIDAEDRERLRDAAASLPPRQRDAVAFEVDPARQSGEVEVKPTGKGHRSSLYKATNRLKEWLAGDGAQDMRDAAPDRGRAASRSRAAPSTAPPKPSTVLVDPLTRTKEGTIRAKEGSTGVVDPSTTTVDHLTKTVELLTSLVEPSTRTVDPLTRGVDRPTLTVHQATTVVAQRFRASASAVIAENRAFRVAERQPARNIHRNTECVRIQHGGGGGVRPFRFVRPPPRRFSA